MSLINGKRILISGLVSSKLNLDEYLISIRNQIIQQGGEIVGELIQRRGVSRSRKPGGSKKLELPLSQRTCISSGKAQDLKKLSENLKADSIVFINELSNAQIKNLEDLIGLRIEIMKPE